MTIQSLTREMERELSGVESVSRSDDGRQTVTLTSPDRLGDAIDFLLERDVSHLVTITGVDADEEINVLYHLLRHGGSSEEVAVTLAVSVPKTDPTIRTITDRIQGASMYERELSDMLGIDVLNHPDPRRLLLPDDWDGGSPLRVGDSGGE